MQDLYEVGFQSPYGELGNTTNQLRSVEDGNPAFQSLTGNWVIRRVRAITT